MWAVAEKIAIISTIVGLIFAIAVAILAFAGFSWSQGRAWLRREFWLRVKGIPLFGGRYITLKSDVLSDIPPIRRYRENNKDFNPNNVRVESEGAKGKCFKLSANIDAKDEWITDWKGRRYNGAGLTLREVWLQVWPYSYRNANEWKAGISILEEDAPVPDPYEHRLYGKGQICYEISRHHGEGKQAILWVFEGHPLKVRSERIAEGNWTWLNVRVDPKTIEFLTGFESIAVFDADAKTGIENFNPNELWLVFWADERTNMVTRFRRVKTYWRKDK